MGKPPTTLHNVLASVYARLRSMQPSGCRMDCHVAAYFINVYNNKRKKKCREGAVEGRIRPNYGKLLFMAWQWAPFMPYTSNRHTNFFLTSGCCACRAAVCMCMCVCVHRTISHDQALVCSWHGLVGYDTSTERERERQRGNKMKTGSQFLDDRERKKSKGEMCWCGFATTVTLGNGLYCNKLHQKQKWHGP